ncbi:MAG: DNA mismatch repair protein MutS [Bacteroidota bacterium]
MSKSTQKGKRKETPLMRQYYAIKAKYPGTVLLFRVGDFYETFGEDAIEVSKVLGIVLTKRANGAASHVELAGFPHHALDTYLPKLIRAGKRVAVCDQLEDPKQAKGIVKRGVTELVTPGVTFNDKVLEGNKHNYLASLYIHNGKEMGLAFLEVSTGEFFCCSGEAKYVQKIIQTLDPSELLVAKKDLRKVEALLGENVYTTRIEDWAFQYDFGREKLLKQFGTSSLKGFGVEEEHLGTIAAGVILYYLDENQQKEIGHINKIFLFEDSKFVWMDPFTVRNLELIRPLHPDGKALVEILDKTLTPMGARLLRKSLLIPLKDAAQIQQRLDIVETFLKDQALSKNLGDRLNEIGDLERLAAKLAIGRITPKESVLLRQSLQQVPLIKHLLLESGSKPLAKLAHSFEEVSPILEVLDRYLEEEIEGNLGEGGIIKTGIAENLDELRDLKRNGKERLLDMQQREVRLTGISSLKIGYNKVFGYYLEVTHAHKDKVPDEWIRKQTLTNAERYITEELKSYEERILSAEEQIQQIEGELYQQMLQLLQGFMYTLQGNARVISGVDMLLCFSLVALQRSYVLPEISSTDELKITQGRHPVIEYTLPSDAPYIPNDVHLNRETQQILIITGPNMAGKSALLRQTALIVIMAQMGCFVPAESAHIGLVDKIFTRVGASDNISSGESTFMVEMNETAQIANNASPKSLILLDEIGRGTSTYDGVSIAWALVEYLHETPACQARTMFATHYHELNELEGRLGRVKNYNVAVKEVDGKVLFLRKLREGGSEHSFGIHVAEMAGMPQDLVRRAQDLLKHFEQNRVNDKELSKQVKFSTRSQIQLNMFELKDADTLKIREILQGVDIDRMTPVEALLKLKEIKEVLLN